MKHITRQDQQAIHTTTLSIGGLCCGACVGHVTSALGVISGVVHVDVELETGDATVEHQADFADWTGVVAKLAAVGYQARIVEKSSQGAAPGPGSGGCSGGCGCSQRPR